MDLRNYKGREQTYLKHVFLQNYLETVAYHIGYAHPEFVYVDCFSGPWRAQDEELSDTSIRIALDQLKAVGAGLAKRQKHPRIRAIFVEKSPVAFAALQQALALHSGEVQTTALPGTFEDNIGKIVEMLGSTFSFVFVDPTGWSGFAMDNLRPLLERGRGEVMINFMYDFVNRFLSFEDAANETSLDRCFGTTAWRDVRERTDREAALVQLYVEQVRNAGRFRYATHTRILNPLRERAYFHLVYATRNAKGIEQFREVEKRMVREQEEVREAAQREHREDRTGQAELEFEPGVPSRGLQEEQRNQRAKALSRLMDLVRDHSVRYEDLLPQVLELPLVWRSEFNQILLEQRRSGQLTIEGMGPRDRVPKEGCAISRRLR